MQPVWVDHHALGIMISKKPLRYFSVRHNGSLFYKTAAKSISRVYQHPDGVIMYKLDCPNLGLDTSDMILLGEWFCVVRPMFKSVWLNGNAWKLLPDHRIKLLTLDCSGEHLRWQVGNSIYPYTGGGTRIPIDILAIRHHPHGILLTPVTQILKIVTQRLRLALRHKEV